MNYCRIFYYLKCTGPSEVKKMISHFYSNKEVHTFLNTHIHLDKANVDMDEHLQEQVSLEKAGKKTEQVFPC